MMGLSVFAYPTESRAEPKKETVPPAKSKTKPKIDPKELYGDQGGEKIAAGNARTPNTVMRARVEDTFLKLSDPRLVESGAPGQKRKSLAVDYEVVSRGKFDGGFIVLHADDGSRAEVELKSIVGKDNGTIELVGVRFFGNVRIVQNGNFPANLELYVTRGDDRYDPSPRFMVSNSVVMGKMKFITRPRDWTAEEIEKNTKPPPSYKNPNLYPDVGVDVPLVASTQGQSRYVDPEGRLIGLDYMIGDWEKQKTVWRLVPVFNPDQPTTHTARVVAKKGYAVSGAEVNENKYVLGIRLLFRRVKPDGTLDEKDAYAGEWIGTPPTGESKKLADDGRRVIGINIKQFAIVDRFSLVVEGEAK